MAGWRVISDLLRSSGEVVARSIRLKAHAHSFAQTVTHKTSKTIS